MKKLVLFMIFLVTMVFFSCSSTAGDPTDPTPTTHSVPVISSTGISGPATATEKGGN